MGNTEEVHKIQWHPGFYGDIELTLIRYKDKLTFEQEHQLSKEHPELRILSDHVKEEDIKRFASYTRDLTDPGDRNNVEAVLHVSVTANQALYDDIWKENCDMSDAYKEWCMNVCKKKISSRQNYAVKLREVLRHCIHSYMMDYYLWQTAQQERI